MRIRAIATAALALAVVASACSDSPRSARDAVDLYFRCLGRDPIRSLELLSSEFQLAHGLRLAAPAPEGAPRDDLAAARVAWLNGQKAPGFREKARRLAVEWLELHEVGHEARARVRVTAPGSSGFEQHFHLSRAGRHGDWVIDAVDQAGLDFGNLPAAFVAHPTERLRLRIERSLGRAPGPP